MSTLPQPQASAEPQMFSLEDSSSSTTIASSSHETKEREVKEMKDTLSLDNEEEDKDVSLISKDGKKFTVKSKYTHCSNVCKTVFESRESDIELPLNNINSTELEQVVEYMNYCKGIETLQVKEETNFLSVDKVCDDKWAVDFVNRYSNTRESQEKLYKLTEALNYLEIKQLLQLCCAKFATYVAQMNVQEIVDMFNINETNPENFVKVTEGEEEQEQDENEEKE